MPGGHSENQAQTNSLNLSVLILGLLGYLIGVTGPFLVASLFDEQFLKAGLANLGVSFAGMIAFSIVAMQFVLMARIPWLEMTFGYKFILALHKTMAVVASLFVFIHIGFLVWSRGNWNLVLSPRASWLVFFGRVGAVTLILILAFSFCRKGIPINNADWRWAHNALAWTILVSGFVHSITLGSSFEALPVTLVWVGYFVIATLAWLFRHYGRH